MKTNEAVNVAVYGTVCRAVNGTVSWAIIADVYQTVDEAMDDAVNRAMLQAVVGALSNDPLHPSLQVFLADLKEGSP